MCGALPLGEPWSLTVAPAPPHPASFSPPQRGDGVRPTPGRRRPLSCVVQDPPAARVLPGRHQRPSPPSRLIFPEGEVTPVSTCPATAKRHQGKDKHFLGQRDPGRRRQKQVRDRRGRTRYRKQCWRGDLGGRQGCREDHDGFGHFAHGLVALETYLGILP